MKTGGMGEMGAMSGTSGTSGMGGHGGMMAMLKDMPKGLESPSGHYWCAMCKKMFELDEPVCPYMPTMCVNTPIPIETLPPGSTAAYERIGLFYPKFIQRLLAAAVQRAADQEALGRELAEAFLADLAEWTVEYKASPIETMKAFIIYTSGFDVAVRNTAAGLTLYVMDAQSLWGEEMPAKKRSKAALLAGARRVAEAVGLGQRVPAPLDLHFMSVTAGPMGKYYCAQCRMFFEYGQPQDKVTCPFMPQKCKFSPQPVAKLTAGMPGGAGVANSFDLEGLTKIYAVSPKLFRRQIAAVLAAGADQGKALDAATARDILVRELATWGFDLSDMAKVESLLTALGLQS